MPVIHHKETPPDGLFKDPKFLKGSPEGDGVVLAMTVENGNLIIDHGEDVRTIAMTGDQLQQYIGALIQVAMLIAVSQEPGNKETAH
jgi:hypothetical protein